MGVSKPELWQQQFIGLIGKSLRGIWDANTVLYDSSSSYTGAVYDHLNGFCRYGLGDVYFCDCNIFVNFMPFEYFQSVVIHYSVRVAHNNVPRELTYILRGYKGTKVLFCRMNMKIQTHLKGLF